MKAAKTAAIIGAGPSGLMAAERLAKAGFAVTIYDRMPNPARKFLLAGRGGLNLTHSEDRESFMGRYGAAAPWLRSMLEAFTPQDLRQWCEGLGIETFVGTSGRVFPRSMKAVPLLRAWLKRLEEYGVTYKPRHTWKGWEGNALILEDAEGQRLTITPDATLFALGGASWPRLGSDGHWMPVFAAAGVECAPLVPANCGFCVGWSDHFTDRFAGTPVKSVALRHEGREALGEVMITAQGIEGGAVYALSGDVRDAVMRNGKAEIHLDVRPTMTVAALTQKFGQARGNKSLSSFLKQHGIAPVAIHLLRETIPAEDLAKMGTAELAYALKNLVIPVTATAGIEKAISSAGGIRLAMVDENLMLRAKPACFVAGEMLDWEAPTGGYLLQACFSTAVAAAEGIRRFCA